MIETKLLSIEDLDKIEIQEQLKQAINQNKLVIFPTETVYGIGGNALSEYSAKAIY
ncbi:MAG TPA: threonylcarbamoyl-AMP synthase, partial [Acholeplasmataceae bacterium]|nr:threonylcarbamoyl-AMP synthase [Acholeplasmataceae bacterium]